MDKARVSKLAHLLENMARGGGSCAPSLEPGRSPDMRAGHFVNWGQGLVRKRCRHSRVVAEPPEEAAGAGELVLGVPAGQVHKGLLAEGTAGVKARRCAMPAERWGQSGMG